MPPQELWHWVHSSYGEELGLTSSDDDYVPPPNLTEGKDGQSKDGTLVNKVCKSLVLFHSTSLCPFRLEHQTAEYVLQRLPLIL